MGSLLALPGSDGGVGLVAAGSIKIIINDDKYMYYEEFTNYEFYLTLI